MASRKVDRSRGKSKGNKHHEERVFSEHTDSILLNEEELLAQASLNARRNYVEEEDSEEEEEEKPKVSHKKESKKKDYLAFDKSFEESLPSESAQNEDEPRELTRKEKEALAAKEAKEHYQKLHAAGKTEQARKDLARLAEVRARREAAAKIREAEGRAPGWNGPIDSDEDEEDAMVDAEERRLDMEEAKRKVEEKKTAALTPAEEPSVGSEEIPKLKAMDIKKLNGDALKEACKLRGLSYQGQKKDLIKRLTDYEAARN